MLGLPFPRETGLLSHSLRGVRAPGATETPESPRVPRGGLTCHPYAVSGRPEPTSHVGTEAREPAPCLWAQPGEGPSPKEREETETGPRPRGCPRSTTQRAEPQRTCTVQGLPPFRLFFFFQGVFVVLRLRSRAPFLGPGFVCGRGPHPLTCGSAQAFSPSCGEGPCPGRAQGHGAGSRVPRALVVEGLRASRDRVRRARETTTRNAHGGLRPRGDAPRADCG